MDIHLDDRLLHGRIIHGWGDRWGVRRYVLFSSCLGDESACVLYRCGEEETGCRVTCLASPEAARAHEAAEGDFWLVDAPAAALRLAEARPGFDRLILIGLRDAGGEVCGEDVRVGVLNRALLEQAARNGLAVVIKRFPEDEAAPLPGLAT